MYISAHDFTQRAAKDFMYVKPFIDYLQEFSYFPHELT